jgi:hypothetical protein
MLFLVFFFLVSTIRLRITTQPRRVI